MILSDDKELARLISSLPIDISEYCFSNVFCFQDNHSFEYSNISGLPFIAGKSGNTQYLMPLFPPSTETIPAIKEAMSTGLSLYPIPEEWIKLFTEDNAFKIEAYEKDFDYVFLKERLAEMSGSKLSKKRNLVSQFTKSCPDISVKPFSTQTQKDAIEILDVWTKVSAGNDKTNTDYPACLLGINNFETLNLSGIIVYSAGTPVAFSLGELIREDYILHFAKADIFCKGVYQYLFQETAKYTTDAIWINFEQDLGVLPLQKMKSSYYPDKLIKKYTISVASNV
jgi:hypothetical protein